MKFILFFVFAFFLVGILAIPASLAQDAIPSWIKNNAGWWADDKIDDFTFAQGVGFLIKNKIIQIDDLPTTSDGEIAIENEGTVTFSGVIHSVLVDGKNFSNFNEKTLNTLEGKHSYKVTLID